MVYLLTHNVDIFTVLGYDRLITRLHAVITTTLCFALYNSSLHAFDDHRSIVQIAQYHGICYWTLERSRLSTLPLDL